MRGILQGIRPLDYVLAAAATAAGAYLMYENTTAAYGAGLPHPQTTTTAAMIPFFVLVTLPILWRRRNVLAVVGVTGLATALHVLLFGWNTRCGVAYPLLCALAYAVARFAVGRKDQLTGLGGVLAIMMVLTYRDASIDIVPSGLAVGIPAAALFYAAGRLVQNQIERRTTGGIPMPATA